MAHSSVIARLAKTDFVNEVSKLPAEESKFIRKLLDQFLQDQVSQVQGLFDSCNITFQYAKTHSVLLKDCERTRITLARKLPQSISQEGREVLLSQMDRVMENKLEAIRKTFKEKFGESLFNYLGADGKTKKLFGLFG